MACGTTPVVTAFSRRPVARYRQTFPSKRRLRRYGLILREHATSCSARKTCIQHSTAVTV